MKRLRDGFKPLCIQGSRNLSADALSSDGLSNIQGLMRSKLRAVVSFSYLIWIPLTLKALFWVGRNFCNQKNTLSSEKLRWQETLWFNFCYIPEVINLSSIEFQYVQ